MRWGLVLVMAAGCRQVLGLETPDLSADAATDAAADAQTDAQTDTCVERWIEGPRFDSPSTVLAPSILGAELPFVIADGTRLYFVRQGDVYAASAAGGGMFAGAIRVEGLSSGNNDGKTYVDPTETRAFATSSRNGAMSGGQELWRGARADATATWAVDQQYLGNLSAPGDQENPHLTADLLHIYFVQQGDGIVFAERNDSSVGFEPATTLPGISATLVEDDTPTLTEDERVIVFASRRSGNWELWYAVRDLTGSFTAPQLVPDINDGARVEDGAHLTPDGCALYFSSDRNGTRNIFKASLLE